MAFTVKWDNNIPKYRDELEIKTIKALETIGLVAEGYAKRLCPKDTGRLQNSITHTVDLKGKAAYIGTNVEYAPYVELGTSRMKAANDGRGYLRPAAQDHADEYKRIFDKTLST